MTNQQEMEYSHERFNEEKRDFEKQLDLISNLPLDSLLDLYHCPEIKVPKLSTERYIHGIDLLNSLNCYNNSIVALHYACAQCADSIIPLVTLLDEGTDINMCNIHGDTAFEYFAKCERRSNRVNEIVRHFFKQVHKLVSVGLHVHEQNRRQYEIIKSREDMKLFVDQHLKINYDEELNRMKNDVMLKDQLTLRDILRDEIDLTPMLNIIKKFLKDVTFESNYPRLWCIVKMRYQQFVTRQEWMPLINDALRILTGRKLPQNCLDTITKELMNYDIANLLTVAFDQCLRSYKNDRRTRRNSMSIQRSPRKMLPRI